MLVIKNSVTIFLLLLSTLLLSCATTQQQQLANARRSYVNHDYTRAVDKLLKLAEAGNSEAQYALGYMYYYGLGIAKDQDIARSWIQKAAQQKYPPAITALHEMTETRPSKYISTVKTNSYNTSQPSGTW